MHHLKVTQESLNLRKQRNSLGRHPFLNSSSGFKSPYVYSQVVIYIFHSPTGEK